MNLSAVFFGSSEDSALVLAKLAPALKIVAVVTQPEPLLAQTNKAKSNPVAQFAQKCNISLFRPSNLGTASPDSLDLTQPDFFIIADYGKILPLSWLNYPRYYSLNIHPSLLPKYRGPSPVRSAILAGEKKTGVSIIKMDKKCDAGPIIFQVEEKIYPKDTQSSLKKRLFSKGADLLIQKISSLKSLPDSGGLNRISFQPQDESQATYTRPFTKKDGLIDWAQPPQYLERFIRAMHPWPGAFAFVRLHPQKSKTTLKILKTHLKSGRLVIDQVQLPGKKPISFKQFKAGYPQYQFF